MQDTRRLRILLIEDDPVHAMLIRRAFDRDGRNEALQIDHVSDGEEALQRLLGGPDEDFDGELINPDLILLDLRLPTIDGFEVLAAMRESERTRAVPVVVISTSDRISDVNRSYRLGANAYVSKPPDFELLTDRLNGLSHFWTRSAELPST